MQVTINPERPDTPEAIALIDELEAILAPGYPPESRHGYSVQKLIDQGVAFFVIRVDGTPAGCGGVQLFGAEYGELKRMYVRPAFRGLGLAKRLIDTLSDHARANAVTLLRLETGIYQHEAVGLYERLGFARVGPFGSYKLDPLSIFYEKSLG
jgi:GNAT superfamily N-acetyltransferase